MPKQRAADRPTLMDLNEPQLEAAMHSRGPLLVFAGMVSDTLPDAAHILIPNGLGLLAMAAYLLLRLTEYAEKVESATDVVVLAATAVTIVPNLLAGVAVGGGGKAAGIMPFTLWTCSFCAAVICAVSVFMLMDMAGMLES